MRRLNLIFATALVAVALGAQPAVAQIAKTNGVVTMKDALKEMLQNHGAATLKKVSVTVDADKSKALAQTYGVETAGTYTVYQGIGADKSTVTGTVVIVNEQGKEGPLQLLVALNPEGKIYDLGFTVFGEDKGKSASTWGFLKQFVEKKAGDPFVVGNDIDGVSGATWSSNSVTSAAERGVVVFAEFLK
ncbi:MAG: FMN-binding protein [Rhodothermales bacterium]|nr:FMN-binding protein [Rhodothermales bacterium]